MTDREPDRLWRVMLLSAKDELVEAALLHTVLEMLELLGIQVIEVILQRELVQQGIISIRHNNH